MRDEPTVPMLLPYSWWEHGAWIGGHAPEHLTILPTALVKSCSISGRSRKYLLTKSNLLFTEESKKTRFLFFWEKKVAFWRKKILCVGLLWIDLERTAGHPACWPAACWWEGGGVPPPGDWWTGADRWAAPPPAWAGGGSPGAGGSAQATPPPAHRVLR